MRAVITDFLFINCAADILSPTLWEILKVVDKMENAKETDYAKKLTRMERGRILNTRGTTQNHSISRFLRDLIDKREVLSLF